MSEDILDCADQRTWMIDDQIKARGVRSKGVLNAMARVPREEFVLPEYRRVAYRDGPLPIGCGQTISQPYIVALMTEALELCSTDRVLEIGTGSGYQAAILGEVCAQVYTIERHADLARQAEAALRRLGFGNVFVTTGDGSVGLPDKAPFDAIIVTAGAPVVPRALLRQLEFGGRLVIPVGEDQDHQVLVRIRRDDNTNFTTENLGSVRFVPLIGKEGWHPRDETVALPRPDQFHSL